MDDRRDILIALSCRLLLALPLVVMAWWLFAGTRQDPDGGGKQLLGLVCALVAGIMVVRPLVGLVAEPAGSLFYPRRSARPEPGYSLAETRRTQGRFEEAIDEYQRIAAQFPAEVHPYVAMMEIAFLNLHDSARGDAIAKQALMTLRDDSSCKALLRAHREIKARAGNTPPASTAETVRAEDGGKKS